MLTESFVKIDYYVPEDVGRAAFAITTCLSWLDSAPDEVSSELPAQDKERGRHT